MTKKKSLIKPFVRKPKPASRNPDSVNDPLTHPRIERPLMKANVRLRRMITPYNITATTVSPVLTGYTFKLSDVVGYAEFTAAYDQYRITKVAMMFKSNYNAVGGYPTANKLFPYLLTAVDLDDGAAPSFIDDMFQISTTEIHMCYEKFNVEFQPRIALAAYQSTFTGYAMAPQDMWLDCASASIEHYGMKSAISAAATSAEIVSWVVFPIVELEFRFTR